MLCTEERLVETVKKYALEVAPEGKEFTLKSGAKSKYYLDCRNLCLTPSSLQCVVFRLWLAINESEVEFDAFGGPCIGADPIVGGLAVYASYTSRDNIRGFLVRKEAKDHGKGGRIVGPLKPGDRAIVIEDVVTSGQSSLSAINAVEEFGAKVVHVFSVVDRCAGGEGVFQVKGIPYTHLMNLFDFGLIPDHDGYDFTNQLLLECHRRYPKWGYQIHVPGQGILIRNQDDCFIATVSVNSEFVNVFTDKSENKIVSVSRNQIDVLEKTMEYIHQLKS